MSHLIALENVEKTYRLGEIDVPALRGVSEQIDRGEFVAIMGASGSGKSTLMNILGLLDRPTGGRYLLDDRDVTSMTEDQLARVRNKKIGFVFQSYNLLSRTSAIENVELPLIYNGGGADKRGRAEKLLVKVGLGDRMHHHPGQLSGGEQQRVAIARALINEPPLILADEPTGNLDTKSSREIMELFKAMHAEGITIVMVTHEDDIAAYAQRVINIRDGRKL